MKNNLYSTTLIGLLLLLITFASLISCSTKKIAYIPLPCETLDTEEEFSSVGTAQGDFRKKGIVQFEALVNANNNLSIQIKQSYKDFIKLNKDSVWTILPVNLERRLIVIADSIIESRVEMAYQNCLRYGGVDKNGEIAAYTNIKISKAYIANVIATGYYNELSDEEKEIIQFNKDGYEYRLNNFFKSYAPSQR